MFLRKSRIFYFRILFFSLIVLSCLGAIISFYGKTNIKQCFLKPLDNENVKILKEEEDLTTPQLLNDVLLGNPSPTAGRSIFFHETSCKSIQSESLFDSILLRPTHINFANLTAREGCAIESAAIHNPNLDIFVLFASPAYWEDNTTNPIIKAILSYSNIYLRNVNLWTYAESTPIENWFKTDMLFKSSYVLSHLSDFLRYLTLWRWGGTYLDMDVVVLQSLEDLPPNYTGAESDKFLAAGVMNFGIDKIGRKVAEYCLNDFQQNFNGQDWGNNGPGVITRTLKHICQTDEISEMFDKERCLGFQVYKKDAFYAIPWKDWEHFFNKKQAESTLKAIEKSYIAHVWNKHSQYRKLHVGDGGAYGTLAAKHCPKVYAVSSEDF